MGVQLSYTGQPKIGIFLIVQYILQRLPSSIGLPKDVVDRTPLHCAIVRGDILMVDLFFKEYPTCIERTDLTREYYVMSERMIAFLLKRGLNYMEFMSNSVTHYL
jgi:hypothetical protein